MHRGFILRLYHMSLPSFSNYWKSKIGHRRCVNWLLGTADRVNPHALDGYPGAREALRQPVDYNSIDYVTARPLKSHGYLAVAAVIVRSKCEIPPWVLSCLHNTLEIRRKLTTRWQKLGMYAESVRQATEQHAYFNGVLAATIELLEPRASMPRGLSPDPVSSFDGAQDSRDETNGDLASLEDLQSDRVLEIAFVADPAAHSDDTPRSGENNTDDTLLALSALFGHMEEVGLHLQKVWTDYRDGRTSLMNASLTTDTAFALMQLEESVLAATFPRLSNYTEIAEHLNVDLPDLEASVGTESEQEEELLPFADVFRILRQSTYTTRIRGNADDPNGWRGSQLWRSFRETEINGQREGSSPCPGFSYLLELLRELWLFQISPDIQNQKIWRPDTLTRGILDMFQTKSIPTWLVFACRVYVDIRTTIGLQATWFQRDLAPLEREFQCSLEEFLRELKERWPTLRQAVDRVPEMPPEALKLFLKEPLNLAHLMNRILRKECYSTSAVKDRLGLRPTPGPYLLRIHPLLCGQMVFEFFHRIHDLGIKLMNGTWDIVPLAHLYNAGRLSGLITTLWADMETLISIHGRIFLLLPDSNDAEKFHRLVRIAHGEKLRAYARDSRTGRVQRDPARKRLIKPAQLMELIMQASHDREDKARVPFASLHQIVNFICPPQPGNTSNATTSSSLAELLASLQTRIAAEEPHLNFPYLNLFTRLAAVPIEALGPNGLGPDVIGSFWGLEVCKSQRWAPLVISVLKANYSAASGGVAAPFGDYRVALGKLVGMLMGAVEAV
ncbi:hypothetical protein BU16DRAFT_224582 [Lophium mytilinum]|uniref:DUF6604 domain-containing protein n=1 Tax=Lophium mytilinum TaxID=390894 RepID=A0A6A6Q9A4_9PEZI|nr:hypothetical protein BU16DRAFT_224582 [Lophium mytilinum]